MAGRRASFPEAELRRWARIARAEGVAIRGTRDVDGTVTVIVEAANAPSSDNSFDRMMGGGR